MTLTGRYTENGGIHLSDGRYLSPPPASNGDWEWCRAENTAGRLLIADAVATPLTVADFASAVEGYIDAVARERSYSSAVSCASYVNSSVAQWAAEADAFITWRDQTWSAAFTALAAWEAGGDAPASPDAFVATLPAITWPAASAPLST